MVAMVTKTYLGQHFGEVFKHIRHVQLTVKIDKNLGCKVLNMAELKVMGRRKKRLGWRMGYRGVMMQTSHPEVSPVEHTPVPALYDPLDISGSQRR